MPKVLVEKKYNSCSLSVLDKREKAGNFPSGKMEISFMALLIFVLGALLLGGLIYLFQVNDLATKGFEVKDVENRIDKLQEERKSLRLKETELKSMYNLEKEVKDLDLVNCSNVSYVEKDGPLAMK